MVKGPPLSAGLQGRLSEFTAVQRLSLKYTTIQWINSFLAAIADKSNHDEMREIDLLMDC